MDDHALVRSAVRQAIAAEGVELVAEAATAEDAFALALSVRPDVLLLDIDLPGMSGLQMLRGAGATPPRDEDRDAHGVGLGAGHARVHQPAARPAT